MYGEENAGPDPAIARPRPAGRMLKTGSPQHSETKSQKEQREEESILEAIAVSSAHNDKESKDSYDIEKKQIDQDPAPKETAVLDWTGPDDPDNPINWSRWKKARHFWPVRSMDISTALSSSD